MQFINLWQQRFGRWTVLGEYKVISKRTYWLCECDCGAKKLVDAGSLRRGLSKSCGCLLQEISRYCNGNASHNASYTTEYHIWRAMRDRCRNPNNKAFPNYGGRGISVCDRWLNSFDDFLVDMGKRPSSAYTLDRINNDGSYSPENCRWATYQQQARNSRKRRKRIKF